MAISTPGIGKNNGDLERRIANLERNLNAYAAIWVTVGIPGGDGTRQQMQVLAKRGSPEEDVSRRAPLNILSSRPPYIAERASPVSPPVKRYYVEWGTVNDVVATNWDSHFDLSTTTYFFAEITFAPSEQLMVASWRIVRGTASNSHTTPSWPVGAPRPPKMIILLGAVHVDGTTHNLSLNALGSIFVNEQITTIEKGGEGGETLIGKQLLYIRLNYT